MSDVEHEKASSTASTPPASRRVAFEQLRERTDELELLISGISLLALIALPNWLFDHWVRLAVHLDGDRLAVVTLAFPLAIGLSYSLAGAFLLHLAVRAYWVGLIGLKAVFPSGIRWQSLRNLGPVNREYYQKRIVDLETSIDAADRSASVIFAMISLMTLSVLWIGSLLIGIILLGMLIGYLLALSDASTNRIVTVLTFAIVSVPLLILALDRGTALIRTKDVPPPVWLKRILHPLLAVQSTLMPQRLILPVQLSLESNLPKLTFSLAFMAILASTVTIGIIQPRLERQFAQFGDYHFLDEASVTSGLRSASYESLRSHADRLLFVPMIPSDLIADSYLRVFLPYVPDRDNDDIRELCGDTSTVQHRQYCLLKLWTVQLDGKEIDTSTFVPAERRDLGLRGIQGYVSLSGIQPGAHLLTALRRTTGAASHENSDSTYQIPFWFAPPYQLELPGDSDPQVPAVAPTVPDVSEAEEVARQ